MDSTKVGMGQIWLDHVNGLTPSGQLPAGGYASFIIHMKNDTWINMQGITNGFRINSPDGASRTGTSGAATAPSC